MVIKQCEFCRKEFDAESANRKLRKKQRWKRFCSRRCRNFGRPHKPIPPPEYFARSCGLCGETFDATPSRPQYEEPLAFCKKCLQQGRIHRARQRFASCKTTLTCGICGKAFTIPIRLVRSGKYTGKFCSLGCAYKGRKRHGHEFIPSPVGSRRPNIQGYIMVYQPQNFDAVQRRERGEKNTERARGWILEHRYIMEQIMGRALYKWESVHHIDGNRANNDRTNLELWIKTQPTGVRLADVADVYGAELVAARLRIKVLEDQLSHRPT